MTSLYVFVFEHAFHRPAVSSEFLPNAAGEDVVAGIRTPQPLEEMALKWPDVYAELFKYQDQLEDYYGDMQVCQVWVST